MADEDDVAYDEVSPNPDVFSYFTLTAPSERKKFHTFTIDAFMSYLLVFVVLFIQGTLLFCVSSRVIYKNIKWQNGMISTGKNWNIIGAAPVGCSDGKSLCTPDHETGMYTCAPPSVQLIGRWHELDLDKDDVWTYEEALVARDDLKCKYAVDPAEVFSVFAALLQERKKFIWLHPKIKSGKAIPKPYFTYIMGDVAMCGYRNGDMCGNLMKRGVFDAALIHGTVPRVGRTANSALDYCHSLLDQGGLCERMLPSTYSTWKIESVEECRDADYDQFVYTDPNDGHTKSLLEVDYEARKRYEMAKTPVFIMYKICIIFIWLLLIVSQVRDVSRTMSWVLSMPITSQREEAAEEGMAHDDRRASLGRHVSELRNDELTSIGIRHRMAMSTVTALRLCMLAVLCYVGLTFLGRQTDYIGLLLDGVALLFIVEVEEIIYERVLRQEVRSRWEEREPMEFKKLTQTYFDKSPDVMDLIWFCFVAIAAISFQIYYTIALVHPLYDALQCSCLSQGDSCQEAKTFSTSFWDHYWKKDVPNAIDSINQLMGGLPLSDVKNGLISVATATSSHTSHVGHVAAKLLQGHLHVDQHH